MDIPADTGVVETTESRSQAKISRIASPKVDFVKKLKSYTPEN